MLLLPEYLNNILWILSIYYILCLYYAWVTFYYFIYHSLINCIILQKYISELIFLKHKNSIQNLRYKHWKGEKNNRRSVYYCSNTCSICVSIYILQITFQKVSFNYTLYSSVSLLAPRVKKISQLKKGSLWILLAFFLREHVNWTLL